MHQPVATDLRRITSVLKISNELERVADLAVHIAERACGLVTWPEVYAPANLKEMAAIAGEMLRNSIDAYVDLDSGLARRVCSRDEIVRPAQSRDHRRNPHADERNPRLRRAAACTSSRPPATSSASPTTRPISPRTWCTSSKARSSATAPRCDCPYQPRLATKNSRGMGKNVTSPVGGNVRSEPRADLAEEIRLLVQHQGVQVVA